MADILSACIGWIITGYQSSCYTRSYVLECVIKDSLDWGSKILLEETRNRETSISERLTGECLRQTYLAEP